MPEPTLGEAGAPPRYETTFDRVGHAVALGAVLIGAAGAVAVGINGHADRSAIATAGAIGILFGMIGIVAVGGPIWFTFHLAGARRPIHAAGLGAFCALASLLAWRGLGIGPASVPVAGSRAGLLPPLLIALAGATIAIAMWRVAYRRGHPPGTASSPPVASRKAGVR